MKKSFNIGKVSLDNPFLLAPLAGITDAPYRLLCRRFGAALVYSEMVSGKGLYYNDKKTDKLLEIWEEEKPVAYQVFGSEPEIMAYTAEKLNERDNVIIDVNMGCPVPKIFKNGEGSALLKTPDLIFDIIEAMVKVSKKPVTAKIRLGIRDGEMAVEAAKAIEAAGGAAVAVHGRTREQYYTGKADWTKIAEVKKAVSIPVIGNGDIVDGKSAMAMMDQTGVDLVMVGRGALGNPWIFKELNMAYKGEYVKYMPTVDEKKNLINEHLDLMVKIKGENVAVREMRKFLGWYIKGMPGSAAIRGRVNEINNVGDFKKLISYIG